MIEFPALNALLPEAKFSADAALQGVLPPYDRDSIPGHVWVEASGRVERLRFYGAAIGERPIIFLEGDIFRRRDDAKRHWTVGEGYGEIAPWQMQAEAEQAAIAIGRTVPSDTDMARASIRIVRDMPGEQFAVGGRSCAAYLLHYRTRNGSISV